MPRRPRFLVFAAAALALAAIDVAAAAKGDGVPYRGMTAQDRPIKLIVDGRGRVKRGSFSSVTRCGGLYKPFTGEFAFRAPLDRSRRDKFRDEGSTLESDSTHSARYKWKIKGKRKSSRKIAGKFSVEIVFRRKGRKYATCTAENVAYSAKLDARKR